MRRMKRGSCGSTNRRRFGSASGRKKNAHLSEKGILAFSKGDRKFGSQLRTEHGWRGSSSPELHPGPKRAVNPSRRRSGARLGWARRDLSFSHLSAVMVTLFFILTGPQTKTNRLCWAPPSHRGHVTVWHRDYRTPDRTGHVLAF